MPKLLRCVLVLLALALLAASLTWAADPPLVRVVQVTSPGVSTEAGPCDPLRLRQMVSLGLQKVTGESSEAAAWAHFVKPTDVVGLKIDTRLAPGLATRKELVQVVVESLRAAGVPAGNLVVWDRAAETMGKAGWTLTDQAGQVRVLATEGPSGQGYLPEFPVLWTPAGAAKPLLAPLAQIPVKRITRLVNLPVLRQDPSFGLSASLPNIAFGGAEGGPGCVQSFAQYGHRVFAHPLIQRTLTLSIADCLRPQYDQGATPNPALQWAADSLLLGICQPAVDAVGRALLNEKRQSGGLAAIPAGDAATDYLAATAAAGLGVVDLTKINWEKAQL